MDLGDKDRRDTGTPSAPLDACKEGIRTRSGYPFWAHVIPSAFAKVKVGQKDKGFARLPRYRSPESNRQLSPLPCSPASIPSDFSLL
jgi:hypothetical protein